MYSYMSSLNIQQCAFVSSCAMLCLIIPLLARSIPSQGKLHNTSTRVIGIDDYSSYSESGSRSYHKITERVDNTVVPSNLAPSEFSPLYASCNEPGPTEFLFSLRTPTPIAHMHVSIFTTSPSKLIGQNIDLRNNHHSTKSGNPGISHNFHHRNMLMLFMHFLYNTSVCNAYQFLDIEDLLKLQ